MTAHSSVLAWRVPWVEKPGGLQSMGSDTAGVTNPAVAGQEPGAHRQELELCARPRVQCSGPCLRMTGGGGRKRGQEAVEYKVTAEREYRFTM